MEELIIPRDIWLHAEGSVKSKLFRPSDQKMCCLGIYLHQCKNVDKKLLAEQGSPKDLAESELAMVLEENKSFYEKLDWLITVGDEDWDSVILNSASVYKLMSLNDSRSIKNREEEIAKEFLKHNIKVTFVDTWNS